MIWMLCSLGACQWWLLCFHFLFFLLKIASLLILLSCYVLYQFLSFDLFMCAELMLLGLISLMLGQWARWISEICVDSSLFNSRFYLCSEEDFSAHEHFVFTESFSFSNETAIPPRGLYNPISHQCPQVIWHSISLHLLLMWHALSF